jgi:hypothetical protein
VKSEKRFLIHFENSGEKKVMENETYFVARLINKGEFLSSEIFESLEEARLWAMRESKLLISDLEMLRSTNIGDICVEIDKHFFGYEVSSDEIMNHSERVV